MKKILLSLFLLGIIISSCVKSNDPTLTPEKLSNIVLGKDTLNMHVGDVRQIDVTLTPATYDKSLLVWTSSDTTVLSVTNAGTLTAKKEGHTTVSVTNTAKTVSVSALVTVTAKPIIERPDSLKIGLIAYYPFNYDSAVDSSGKGNDGTIFDITSIPDRFGKANRAYYFNGNTSYILVNDSQDLRLSNTDFTINTWVKLEDYNASFGTQIMDKRISGVANGWNSSITGYDFQNTGQGKLGLLTFGEGGTALTTLSTKTVALNKWVMLTTVYSFNRQQISYYINGTLDVTVSNVPSPNGAITADLYIGKDNPIIPSTGYYLKGSLDDIRIYNRALSITDIQELYNLPY